MQLVKYLKYSTGDFDLMLFLVVYHEPPICGLRQIYCIALCFYAIFLLCMNLPHTKAYFAAFILLSSPSRGIPLSLNDPSPPKHIQLEADQ